MRTGRILAGALLAIISSFAHAQPAAKPDFTCSAYRERCVIPVYAISPAADKCEVGIDFATIKVPKTKLPGGKKIRVVWILFESVVGDPNTYSFKSATTGVELTGNDPTKDFDSPGFDKGETRRFRWHSVHGRVDVPIDYKMNVTREDPAGGSIDCAVVDPKIINTN
jgi:hypothetical protein